MTDAEIIEYVWGLGNEVTGYNPDIFRQDACGAWIVKDQYQKETPFGWGIDRISPYADERSIENMRPMNLLNIRSKGDSYPRYRVVVTSIKDRNVRCSKLFSVPKKKQEELKKLIVIK